jgi:hypothetical protein
MAIARLMNPVGRFALTVPVFLGLFCTAASAAVIDARTIIYVDPKEPLPIQKAVNDLTGDWKSVFGQAARIVHPPSATSGTTIWVASAGALPEGITRPSGWEQLLIRKVPHAPIVVLSGSDVRGTIYRHLPVLATFSRSRPALLVDRSPSHPQDLSGIAGKSDRHFAAAFSLSWLVRGR